MNTQSPNLMGHSKGSPEREVNSNTGLPKQNRSISNKANTSILTRNSGTEKTTQSKYKEGNNENQSTIK